MLKPHSLAVLLLLTAACQTGPSPCQRIHSSPALPGKSIEPGTYRLIIKADAGARGGASLVTKLRLSAFAPGSGRPPEHLAYGSVRGDLNAVGAAVCGDAPSPDSHNQSSPGVLLKRAITGELQLWIGSAGNQYQPGIVTMDGCGVLLTVESVSISGFTGVWGAAGVVDGGCGPFVAERTE